MATTSTDGETDPWAQVEPEASRRMILGAIEAFAERGFHATTTRDIASRAGLSPAALYVHYPSKAALLGQISRVGHEAAAELVEAAASRELPDTVAALRSVVLEFTAWHARNHRVARVVQYELAALPHDERHRAVALRRRIESVVEGLIRQGSADGVMDVRPAQARGVTRALLSLSIDVARWFDPAGKDSPRSVGVLHADLAVRMVGATEATRGPRVAAAAGARRGGPGEG